MRLAMFQPDLVFDGGRRRLLWLFLLGGAAVSLLVYASGIGPYDRDANLWVAAVLAFLSLWAGLRPIYALLSHVALSTAVLLLIYVVSQTGGINSPAMVWMTILPVPALLLLGRRWALLWVLVSLAVQVGQFVAVREGWIGGVWDDSPRSVLWSMFDKIMVTVGLMLAVYHYERLHRQQVHTLEQSNVALEATQKALHQAQSHQDEFMASVGHELRTPMNAILGLNDVLQTALAARPQALETARHIRTSTEQLLALVNDILDFAQLEAGRLVLLEKPLPVARCLSLALAPYEQQARAKGLRFESHLGPEVPPWLWADAQRLSQILHKLLDNAIKFTPSGGVMVRVHWQAGQLRIEVQDTGVGIATERQQEVFKRFEHADLATQRAYGGAGLGLAICEHLVRLHKGQMGVHSWPGQGATFWVVLPVRSAQAPQMSQLPGVFTPAQVDLQRTWRFLLVDDNATNLLVGKLALQKAWPQALIATATNDQDALAWLEEHPVDLVFMDMVMPGMDGMQTTAQLRAHPNPVLAQLPVLGLTANQDVNDREQCLRAGMNEVLSKPLSQEALLAAVARCGVFKGTNT